MATVVFDLDGTLADTSGDLIAAANATLSGRGLDASLDPLADARTAFKGGRAMLRLGHARAGLVPTDAEIDMDYRRFLAIYADLLHVETRLYPGVAEAVARLGAAGYRTAICTNKPEALAQRLLVSLGVRDAFASLIGADTLPVRKPDPAPLREAVKRAGGDPRAAVLIGDTVTDRDTARAAGVPCVLVTFGPGGTSVGDLAPSALLDDYAKLDAVLAPLLPAPNA